MIPKHNQLKREEVILLKLHILSSVAFTGCRLLILSINRSVAIFFVSITLGEIRRLLSIIGFDDGKFFLQNLSSIIQIHLNLL